MIEKIKKITEFYGTHGESERWPTGDELLPYIQKLIQAHNELEERVKKIEIVAYRLDIEDCPRCKRHAMNHLQTGTCSSCAYSKTSN